MTFDLWSEASRDLDNERAALRMANAKVAVAGLWPFLTLAASEHEFEHRLALAWDHIANAVPVDLLQPITESLRSDYSVVTEAAKNAQGEEEAEGEQPPGGDMPEWLQNKINPEGAYYHQGRRKWVTPQPPPRPRMEFWHEGAKRWVTAAYDTDGAAGGGNPYYFTGGPEAGPATGATNQFPPHPTGSDPVDPLNQMFPMQPTPWTVPPGGEWKEAPMQFNPPEGGHQASHHAAQVGDTGTCIECGGNIKYSAHEHGREWNHTGSGSGLRDDMHVPTPTRNSREAADRYVDEGVETGPPGGKNPGYFSGGGEGVAGDQQSGFPQDVAQEDPDDRVNELYGASPISAGTVDNGHRVAAASPDHPAPDSDPLLGTDFDSPEERDREGKARRGEQQDSRDSSALIGMRHNARRGFYDPSDPGLVMLAFGDQFGADNPFNMGPNPTPPAGAGQQDSTTPIPPTANVPQTTPPRQTPGGGPGVGAPGVGGPGGSMPGTDVSDSAAKQNLPPAAGRRVHADARDVASDTDPTGLGDEYRERTVEGPLSTRPRQPMEHRNPNTPQNPGERDPIRTTDSHSPLPGQDAEDDRREASRVADRLARELVGV